MKKLKKFTMGPYRPNITEVLHSTRVYGMARPKFAGWYCALSKIFIVIEEDHARGGGAREPLSEKKEMVYVHENGKVYQMMFVRKKKEWVPEWSEEKLERFCAFEPIMVSGFQKIKKIKR